jgi:hypothetical protein
MAATDTLSKGNGFGSVHEAPDLPQWFTELFESYVVPAGGLNVHAVIGGKGPP